jgi:nucleotide-binding universal stress UspA family protein
MNAIKRILVPSDFSDASDAALGYAAGFARGLTAQLYLLHVPGRTGENLEADFPIGEFATTTRGRVEAVVGSDTAAQLRPEYAVRIGTPAEEIIRYAGDRDIDLIVMGTHGRSGVAHALVGSVTEKVIRAASCPVVVVRRPKGT